MVMVGGPGGGGGGGGGGEGGVDCGGHLERLRANQMRFSQTPANQTRPPRRGFSAFQLDACQSDVSA